MPKDRNEGFFGWLQTISLLGFIVGALALYFGLFLFGIAAMWICGCLYFLCYAQILWLQDKDREAQRQDSKYADVNATSSKKIKDISQKTLKQRQPLYTASDKAWIIKILLFFAVLMFSLEWLYGLFFDL